MKIELDVIGRERKRKNVAQRDLPRIDQSSPKMDVEEMSFSEKKIKSCPPLSHHVMSITNDAQRPMTTLGMDLSQEQAIYHSAPYSTAGSAMMSFDPVKQIHQHLCAFHTYSFATRFPG